MTKQPCSFTTHSPVTPKIVHKIILKTPLTLCSRLLHPHIIQFREVFLTEKYLAIAMEYAPGGDMFQHVKRRGGLEEAEVPFFMNPGLLLVVLKYFQS